MQRLGRRPPAAVRGAVKVLLTGSAGFIGSAVADRLEAAGDEVLRVDLLIPEARPAPTAAPARHASRRRPRRRRSGPSPARRGRRLPPSRAGRSRRHRRRHAVLRLAHRPRHGRPAGRDARGGSAPARPRILNGSGWPSSRGSWRRTGGASRSGTRTPGAGSWCSSPADRRVRRVAPGRTPVRDIVGDVGHVEDPRGYPQVSTSGSQTVGGPL